MEGLYFLLVGVLLYFVADRVLDYLEQRAGRRFEYRTVVFFALLLGLALAAFAILRRIL
jgi:NhaP-type Na+/H+ or K+/H+ antiporter